MTEASENAYLVRVRAQVMCRDEGTGGWVALGGGGLADVMVGRRLRHRVSGAGGTDSNGDTTSSSASAPTHDYYIHGRRISDAMVVLECTIKKDFQYNKVMPTFHHWVTDEKRFGLTFQTAADARAFDKGVRTAIEELLDAPKDDDEENNIFECLNLPSDSRSSSENSTASRPRRVDVQTPILSAITLPARPRPDMKYEGYDDKMEDSDPERCPYVHLTAVHEYTYPQVCARPERSPPAAQPPLLKRDSGSIKKCSYSGPPPLPDKKPTETFQARIKCRHCHEWYLESANRAGACEYAPDCFRSCIDYVSCIKCAQCMLYHCMSDAEGEFTLHPCACAKPDDACAKRWVGLTILSLLVPCLWCYVPLRCVHRVARSARLAGGLHAPHK
ncbi:sprouty-related, EVH1 domain-containing protein 2 isoform X2 [Epargyreus clarus]|uniref:sprouty-related, EVH1 domain-containing protein 2 isoform X2 n=1 Tax=Epargyreus clarus TaxID=520877 RepID=UPI003C2F6ACA